MAKAELGIKRTCPNCGTRYYDLNRNPIVCPRCGTAFQLADSRARPQTAAPKEEDDIKVEAEEEGADLVPLETADEEAADTGAVAVESGDDEDEEELEAGADETFLEEEDEEDDDVSTIIGDVGEEER